MLLHFHQHLFFFGARCGEGEFNTFTIILIFNIQSRHRPQMLAEGEYILRGQFDKNVSLSKYQSVFISKYQLVFIRHIVNYITCHMIYVENKFFEGGGCLNFNNFRLGYTNSNANHFKQSKKRAGIANIL